MKITAPLYKSVDMRLSYCFSVALAIVFLLSNSNIANGELVYNFTSGSFISGDGPHTAGDNITGQFTLNTTPSLPFTGSVSSFFFTYNDNDGSSDFSVNSEDLGPFFGGAADVTIDSSGTVTAWFFFTAVDSDQDTFADLDSFTIDDSIAQVENAQLAFEIDGPSGSYGAGEWSLAPVPEPTSLLTFGIGCMLLTRRRRR